MDIALSVISDQSTRTEIAEALGHCNAQARRCCAFDNLSRPNPHWAKLHAFMNQLLDLWQTAPDDTQGGVPDAAAHDR